MQARDAVFSAIHKLHDLRVLSDKTRLMVASSRSSSIDVNTHEKFQALVETCVVKSQGKTSADSANGSPDKEAHEDESKLERHSSYSTSGSAETQQDSRSSQEVKDTGIDVERPHHIHELVEDNRKPFSSSPDLNLNLDSNDSYSPASPTLTAHMAGLHVVKPAAPPKTVSVMGVEVQASDPRVSSHPPFPLHFYGPSSEPLRPAPLQPDAHVDNVGGSSHHPNRLSESSFGAESSTSVSQGF
jgi:hypothetical protein